MKPTEPPRAPPTKRETPAPEPVQQFRRILDGLAHHRYENVVVMVGAGISTAAGIPDFRSPKTGLYDNLQRFKLPYPEAVFDIAYLRQRPEAFFMLAEELYPTQFEPTTFHRFIKWINDLGALKRVYTQNIDTLESVAGIPAEKIVFAHGSFAASHCIDCHAEANKAEVEQTILSKTGRVPRCAACGGIVKPDIVFFGEGLPDRFFDMQELDFKEVDLAIVAGTSLQVSPFNQLPNMVPKTAPRVLVNMEPVGSLGHRKRDLLVLGKLEDLDPLLEEYIDAPIEEASEDRVSAVASVLARLGLNRPPSKEEAHQPEAGTSQTEAPTAQGHESATAEPSKAPPKTESPHKTESSQETEPPQESESPHKTEPPQKLEAHHKPESHHKPEPPHRTEAEPTESQPKSGH